MRLLRKASGPLLAGTLLISCDSYPTQPSEDNPESIPTFAVVGTSILPAADAYVKEDEEHGNWGLDLELHVGGKIAPGRRERTLLRFEQADIEQVAGTGTLTKATLQVPVVEASQWGGSGAYVLVHRLTQDWSESGVTWACAKDTVPSNGASDCAPEDQWQMDGPVAFFAPPSDSVLMSNDSSGTAVEFDVTADVEAFLQGGAANFGWLLKKQDEAGNGNVVFRSSEIPHSLQLGIPVPGPWLFIEIDAEEVPAEAPDSFPSTLFVDAAFIEEPTGDLVSTRILSVGFDISASLADKQSAIDLVSGTVIGGVAAGVEGLYMIEVQGDGTIATIDSIAALLRPLPKVYSAVKLRFLQLDVTHVLPNDGGPDWDSTSWFRRNEDASGANYNLEAVNAPLAWGCSVGDTATVVAVLDHGFNTPMSDQGNLSIVVGANAGSPNGSTHGNMVASILGASGNNDVGITGMMWEGHVRGYEAYHLTNGAYTVDPNGNMGQFAPDLLTKLQAAHSSGAVAINISLGLSWPSNPGTQGDSARAFAVAQPLLQFLNQAGASAPLVVVSAGNHAQTQGIDAFWNAYPIAADSFPGRALVVGASDSLGSLYSGSKRHPSMVVAPGVDVTSLLADGSPVVGTGTSFAAPVVTGLAGLLHAFDTTTTTADLVDAIHNGAVDGGVTAGGFPVIDAWESLKIRASNPGRPLCGNRSWQDSTAYVVQRGNQTEIVAGPQIAAALSVQHFHGGRRVDITYFLGPAVERTYTWEPSSWLSQSRLPHPSTIEASRRGGFFPSYNHEADFEVITLRNRATAQVFVTRRDTLPLTPLDTVATLSGYFGASAVYSPIEETAFVGIKTVEFSGDITIHSVDLVTGATSPVFSTTVLPLGPFGLNLYLAVSEDGKEILLKRTMGSGVCSLDFVDVNTGQILYNRAVTTISNACEF